MKFTLPWLKEHLDTEADIDRIAETLTRLGLEVDAVHDPTAELAPFSVAEITAVRQHPNADKLNLCTVETRHGTFEVVCGAPNVRPGLKGIFAPEGSTIPVNGMVLKKTAIRGVDSQGMLCSARELKLGEDHTGIIDLDGDPAIGTPAAAALGLEGPVIDVDLTPNRADCFGITGIARELAAAGLGRLKSRPIDAVPSSFKRDLNVTLAFPDSDRAACPLFVARPFRGVRNGPSPAWLQNRLSAIGLRPISRLVDITNLVTISHGRPLHVFDAGKLAGHISLRLGQSGEQLLALDGKTYAISPDDTVISDDTGPISLGGIMGGESTGCDDGTTEVILEVALFDPERVARTGRRLGIDSDARTRFERGVDPHFVLPGVELASKLILELCGGEAGDIVVAGSIPQGPTPFLFRTNHLQRIAGITLEDSEIEQHLSALGFTVTGHDDGFMVTPPSWRRDISHETDVVEEIARLHGYDKIPPVPVTRTETVARTVITPEQTRRRMVRRKLAEAGLNEAVTWSFTREDLAKAFGGVPARLANPISSELSVMRPSLLPNLLLAAEANRKNGEARGALFELGPRFTGDQAGEQEWVAGGVRYGTAAPRHWGADGRLVDALDAKADALSALEAAGVKIDAVQIDTETPSHYHPGRSGRLKLGPQAVLAHFGEIHPIAGRKLDLGAPMIGFEVFLDALPKAKAKIGSRARPPLQVSPFPAVERDFAFIVADHVSAEALIKAVRTADKNLIREVTVFDVYAGKGVEPGHSSIALSVTLQSDTKTLEDSDIEPVVQRIVAAVSKATGASLRA